MRSEFISEILKCNINNEIQKYIAHKDDVVNVADFGLAKINEELMRKRLQAHDIFIENFFSRTKKQSGYPEFWQSFSIYAYS